MVKRQGWHEQYGWILPILLLAFVLRIAYLDAQSLWWDEAFSFSMSYTDLRSLLANALHYRTHPPLYYTLMHFWLALGHSEFLLRVFSVFFGVMSVAAMYATTALVGGRRLAALASLLLALSPFNVWYSQEVRMYSLTTFLVLTTGFFLLRLLRRDTLTNWLAFGLCTVLAVYSDYLHLFVILAQATFLIVLRNSYRTILKKWLCCMAVVGGLYLPWVGAIFAGGGFYQASISWISPVDPTDLFWTIYNFTLGWTSNPGSPLNVIAVLFVISLVVYGLVLWRTRPQDQKHYLGFVLCWLLLPLFFTLLISLDWPLQQKRSIYIDRFFNPLLPAFLILASSGIFHIFKKRTALGVTALVIALLPMASSLHNIFFNEYYARDQWREAIANIRENAQSGDILLVRPHDYVPLYYYSPGGVPCYTVPYLGSRQEYETFLDSESPVRLTEGGRMWAMIACENADTHLFDQGARQLLRAKVERDVVRALLLQRYRLLQEWEYNGIHLSVYGDG